MNPIFKIKVDQEYEVHIEKSSKLNLKITLFSKAEDGNGVSLIEKCYFFSNKTQTKELIQVLRTLYNEVNFK